MRACRTGARAPIACALGHAPRSRTDARANPRACRRGRWATRSRPPCASTTFERGARVGSGAEPRVGLSAAPRLRARSLPRLAVQVRQRAGRHLPRCCRAGPRAWFPLHRALLAGPPGRARAPDNPRRSRPLGAHQPQPEQARQHGCSRQAARAWAAQRSPARREDVRDKAPRKAQPVPAAPNRPLCLPRALPCRCGCAARATGEPRGPSATLSRVARARCSAPAYADADSKHYDFENLTKHPRRFLLLGMPQIGKTGAYLDAGACARARASCRFGSGERCALAHVPVAFFAALPCTWPAARFRDEICARVSADAQDKFEAGDDDVEGATSTEISWVGMPGWDALSSQAFAPLRPGSDKYGDAIKESTWQHYVVDKSSTLLSPEPLGPKPISRGAAQAKSADPRRVRVHARAYSFRHWRDKLHADAPGMVPDAHGVEPLTFTISFAQGRYGVCSIGPDREDREGRLIVPISQREHFDEQTADGRVMLRPLAPDRCLRFPIFQPSSGRARTVRARRGRARGVPPAARVADAQWGAHVCAPRPRVPPSRAAGAPRPLDHDGGEGLRADRVRAPVGAQRVPQMLAGAPARPRPRPQQRARAAALAPRLSALIASAARRLMSLPVLPGAHFLCFA